MNNSKLKTTIFLAVTLALAACGGAKSTPVSQKSAEQSVPQSSQISQAGSQDVSKNDSSEPASTPVPSSKPASSEQTPSSKPVSSTPASTPTPSSKPASSTPASTPAPSSQPVSSAPVQSSEPASTPAPSSQPVSSTPAQSSEPASVPTPSSEPASTPAPSSEPASVPTPSSEPASVPTPSSQPASSQAAPEIDPALAPYILQHAEGQKANYVFEAEYTDTRGKSGTGYSGGTSTYRDFAAIDDHGRGYITYLYREGLSVNFFVVSDRDVNNAKFSISIGAEFMKVHLTPENYAIRVDPDILATDPDALKEIDDGGCLGNWDSFFLDWYSTDETGGYFIENWTCGEIEIGEDGCELGYWSVHTISMELSLKKGFNCISLITDNSEIEGDSPHGTMGATAPVIDYIAIETTAQLGVFGAQELGVGDIKNAVHFA